ncbi:MAG: N-acetyltransferase [Chitinophagaceae bacterium]
MNTIIVRTATEDDAVFAEMIAAEMEASAIARGSGISKRSPSSLIRKMKEGKAIIAVTTAHQWAGFSYVEIWSNGEFVSNSGLIVAPVYRGNGVARQIKQKVFELARRLYPNAKVFSITTGLAIMKMNAELGFAPVTFNELPHDRAFWKGCKSCVNYSILTGKKCGNCLCTAMLYEPNPAVQQLKEIS